MLMPWRTMMTVAVVVGIAISGCSDDDGPSEPTTGAVAITVVTGGDLPDPDGYTLSIDGGTEIAIGVNGATMQTELAPGNHQIALAGLASNCIVGGTNPQTAVVTVGDTTAVTFAVACATPPCYVQNASVTTAGDRSLTRFAASRSMAASGCIRRSPRIAGA